MSTCRVTVLRPDDRQKYEEFLQKNEFNLVYSSLEFRDFLQSAVGGETTYYVAWQDDEICGTLPLFSLRHPEYGKSL